MNVARATEGMDGVVNSQKRENELSSLAREFIFDTRSMEEIKEDSSYKNFLREVKKDEEKNRNFDSVVPLNSVMFYYRLCQNIFQKNWKMIERFQ